VRRAVVRKGSRVATLIAHEGAQHLVHSERESVVQVEHESAGRTLVRTGPGPDAVTVTSEMERRLVRVHQPQRNVVLAGVRGRTGNSSFEDWLERNPGGTWEQFMSELGSGAIWQESEW